MELLTHGGRCCGIKTIYLSSCHPADPAYTEDLHKTRHTMFEHHLPNGRWGDPILTKGHTAGDRLRAYVERLTKEKAAHLLEVTTSTACSQTSNWKPLLEELGFKAVTVFKNSNSMSTVTVWHKTWTNHDKAPVKAKSLSEILG